MVEKSLCHWISIRLVRNSGGLSTKLACLAIESYEEPIKMHREKEFTAKKGLPMNKDERKLLFFYLMSVLISKK